MSIASDLRNYADNAVTQGKQVTDKASSTVNELRASAEKVLNVDALKTAVEPYLAQVKDRAHTVTDKAEALYAQAKSDKRVGKFVEAAESVTVVVVDTLSERVVKPVQSLAGRGAKPGPKPAARKPAATKPAAGTASTTTASAPKPAARKAPAKRTAS